jgi:hypothetical protein
MFSVKPTSGIVHKVFLFLHHPSSDVQNDTAYAKLFLTKDGREQSQNTVRSKKELARKKKRRKNTDSENASTNCFLYSRR